MNARVRYGALLKGFTDLPVWRTTSEGLSFLFRLYATQIDVRLCKRAWSTPRKPLLSLLHVHPG